MAVKPLKKVWRNATSTGMVIKKAVTWYENGWNYFEIKGKPFTIPANTGCRIGIEVYPGVTGEWYLTDFIVNDTEYQGSSTSHKSSAFTITIPNPTNEPIEVKSMFIHLKGKY